MKTKKLTVVRLSILAVFIAFISFEAYMHQVKGGSSEGAPSIHALCPYGGLESLLSLIISGTLIQKIYIGTISLFIISIITSLLFRRGFCGWICPFGGIQEFMGRLGKKILGRQFNIPGRIDSALRYLKYAVLALTILTAWVTASMWMAPFDPWAAYGHLGEGIESVWNEFAIGFIILIITLIGSFFYDRFFCKYLCPMGGFLGLISKLSPFKIKRNEELCVDCNLCTESCSVNIDVARVNEVTSMECVNCQECTAACPREGALTNSFSFADKKKFKPMAVGIILLAVYFGCIGAAKMTGSYSLLPEPITEETVITDTESLRGYMTLSEISNATKIALDDVYSRMGIPPEVPSYTKAKELSQYIPGFDFHEAAEKLMN